jgi:hypothetical protein
VGHGLVFTYTAAALKPVADLIREPRAARARGRPLEPAALTRSPRALQAPRHARPRRNGDRRDRHGRVGRARARARDAALAPSRRERSSHSRLRRRRLRRREGIGGLRRALGEGRHERREGEDRLSHRRGGPRGDPRDPRRRRSRRGGHGRLQPEPHGARQASPPRSASTARASRGSRSR